MLREGFKMTYTLTKNNQSYTFSQDDMELIYDALNEYPQWNDDGDDNPSSVIMNKLYNLLEA
jgi:hypothetical protein